MSEFRSRPLPPGAQTITSRDVLERLWRDARVPRITARALIAHAETIALAACYIGELGERRRLHGDLSVADKLDELAGQLRTVKDALVALAK